MSKTGNTVKATNLDNEFVQAIRQSAPYIHRHRGKTFVIGLPGEALDSDMASSLLQDLAMLNCLGIRVVLAFGVRPQVEACLKKQKHNYSYHKGLRVTDDRALECVKQKAGTVRLEIESLLSRGLANTVAASVQARATSGNFITAQPYGIHDGVDFMHTGIVRRVDAEGIHQQLDNNAIVLLPPLAFSPTGEIFNIASEDVAAATAIALSADKLILLSHKPSIRDGRRKLIRQLTTHEAGKLRHGKRKLDDATRLFLDIGIQSTEMGVQRTHILDWHIEGVLLSELFTRDGSGTLISAEPYDTIRPAHIGDIAGILQIIEPLEDRGILVPRPRDQLEIDINHYHVAVRDDMVVACAALYPFEKAGMAELACLATHPDYRKFGNAEQLLASMTTLAKQQKLQSIFVLTTQTAHWFRERGFQTDKIDNLPVAKRRLYNIQRKSKMYTLKL